MDEGGERMTKGDLVDSVAKSAKISKHAAGEAVDATFDGIAKAIKKSKRFQVPGFGTFTLRSRKARKGRNPQTGAVINIKASRTVGFKAAPVLKKGL
jgi:DNA-binding protein HU-beta